MSSALHHLKECVSAELSLHGPMIPLEPKKPFGQNILDLIDANNPVKQIMSLDTLRDYVATSILVPIDAERTNAVFGVGNPEADIMLVGEAPGADEDQKGEPFVGRAGQLLDKMIAAIQLSRNDLYITNMIKSRPPQNRDPTPDEIAAHLPILFRQMSVIQPKLILCLGRIASQTLLGTSAPLGQLRGQAHPYHGSTLLATYHPAALLRNQSWKRPAWEDLKLLRQLYLSL